MNNFVKSCISIFLLIFVLTPSISFSYNNTKFDLYKEYIENDRDMKGFLDCLLLASLYTGHDLVRAGYNNVYEFTPLMKREIFNKLENAAKTSRSGNVLDEYDRIKNIKIMDDFLNELMSYGIYIGFKSFKTNKHANYDDAIRRKMLEDNIKSFFLKK